MEKLYRVVITEIDPETKAETKTLVDDLYKNVTMFGDKADGENTMSEIVLHDSIMGIASKMANGDATREAIKLAAYMILQDKEK